MAASQTCVHDRSMFSDLVLPGAYDVKLVGLRKARGRPGEVTKRFVFRITRGEFKNRKLCYFAAVNGQDQNFFLKLVLHFLGYSFRSTEDIDFEDLTGRRCRIKIEHRKRDGRIFPQIIGFEFADDQPWK